ncbi:MAG: hypothetical protein J6Y02_13695 [Pseudobutyrivibrio sp.]|nr:hypothetical protein [Pseudobutyrivibrio sp.]
MQLRWIEYNGGTYFETKVFNNEYSVRALRPWSSVEEWVVKSDIKELRDCFKTKEEAMVAAHQIIEKELENGYIRKASFPDRFTSKLSYITEDMFGCKKALALFTNENGDEYIDSVLISATIPKGSLVREVDPEHHDDLPTNLNVCRKCRSDRAVIVDILDPMYLRPGESKTLPSRKTQRKKIPIISVHVVIEALRKHTIVHRMRYAAECDAMRRIINKLMGIILDPNIDARGFGKWLNNITKPRFPVSLEMAMADKVLEPYIDTITRYKGDSYMCCKVLLARILRDIGVIDVALRQSYKIGSKIQIDDFDLDNNACGAGFHFFKTAIEAQIYKFN